MGKNQSFLADFDFPLHSSIAYHLFIVITDPDKDRNYLIVPVVTLKNDWQDKSCTLKKGDHPFIKHESCINYAKAKKLNYTEIYNGIQKGIFIKKEDVSPEVLKKIQDGCRITNKLPNKFKCFFDYF